VRHEILRIVEDRGIVQALAGGEVVLLAEVEEPELFVVESHGGD